MGEQKYVPGEIIIKWRDPSAKEKHKKVKDRHFLKDHPVGPHWERDGITHHHGVAVGREKHRAERIMAEHPNDVEWAEPNGIIELDPVDPDASPQFTASPNDWWVKQVGAFIAAAGIGKLDEIWCGSLDCGYRHAEPFFYGCVAQEKNFAPNADTTTPVEDKEGHGTATLAIVLEILKMFTANPRACVGRVMSQNSASWANVSQGVLWLISLDVFPPAIACSIGGTQNSMSLWDAAQKAYAKGVAWICAAGNAGSTTPAYPANTAGAFAIAATDETDSRAGFSNYGDWIDGAFPGTNFRLPNLSGGDSTFNGTSASAPGFAACVAVVARYFKISGVEAVNRILTACKTLANQGLGAGRVDLAQALGITPENPMPTPSAVPVPINLWADNLTPGGFTLHWTQPDYPPGIYKWEVFNGDYRCNTVAVRYGPVSRLDFGAYGSQTRKLNFRVKAFANDGKVSELSVYLDENLPPNQQPTQPPPVDPPVEPPPVDDSIPVVIEAAISKIVAVKSAFTEAQAQSINQLMYGMQLRCHPFTDETNAAVDAIIGYDFSTLTDAQKANLAIALFALKT